MSGAKVRTIVHIDLDAFFTSVEELDNPELAGKSVVVGPDPQQGRARGVISAANYIARKSGIRSAMPVSQAYRLNPRTIFLPHRFHRYKELSAKFFSVLTQFSDKVEPMSIDEAYLDCSTAGEKFQTWQNLGRELKKAVKAETGLNASVGIGTGKSIAKIISDMSKPNGLGICPPGTEKHFLAPLPASRLWGIGPKAALKLQSMGVVTIQDLQSCEIEPLQKALGKMATEIRQLALGIDTREIVAGEHRQSLSEERTFEADLETIAAAEIALSELSADVCRGLKKENIYARNLQIKIRNGKFETFTRSCTFPVPRREYVCIRQNALQLFRTFAQQVIFSDAHSCTPENTLPSGFHIRLLGVSAGALHGNKEKEQLWLFL